MSFTQKLKTEKPNTENRNAKRRRSKRSNKETAIAILKTDFSQADPTARKRGFKAFDDFHEEMKTRHTPYLPIHFDVVQRATQLRYGLERMHRFKDQFLASLEEIADIRSSIPPQRRKQFTDFLEMMLRTDGLKKLAQYEADLSEEVRKNNHELEEVEDWQIDEGSKRGFVGYHLSKPIDWTIKVCDDDPNHIASSDTDAGPKGAG